MLVCCFHYDKLSAQDIFFELAIDPQPPVYAYEWEQHPELVTIYITNLSSDLRPILIKGRLFNSAGELVGETDNAQMPVTILDPNLNVLYPIEFVPSSAFIFFGDIEEQIARTNRIPEGVYQLCVELLDPEILNTVAPMQCGTFLVVFLWTYGVFNSFKSSTIILHKQAD